MPSFTTLGKLDNMKAGYVFIYFFIALVFGLQLFAGENKPNEKATRDKIVSIAKNYLGTTYKWGSINPDKGFDCSGFVYKVMLEAAVEVPRVSRSYASFGKAVAKEDAQKGDVIVFTGSDYSKKTIGHVGIIISEKGEEIAFIHASSAKSRSGVVISSLNSLNYKKRFVTIRKVL